MNELRDGRTNERASEQTNERTNERANEPTNEDRMWTRRTEEGRSESKDSNNLCDAPHENHHLMMRVACLNKSFSSVQ